MNWVKTKIIAILNFKIQLSPQNSKYGIAYISDGEEKNENTTNQKGRKADQEKSKPDLEKNQAVQEKSNADNQEERNSDQEGSNSDQERRNADQEKGNSDQGRGNSDLERGNADQERGNSDQGRGRTNKTLVEHPKALCPNCRGIGGCLDSQTVIYAFTGLIIFENQFGMIYLGANPYIIEIPSMSVLTSILHEYY